jgi:hypothetical protein
MPRNSVQMASQSSFPLNSDEARRICSDYSQMAQQTSVNNALGTLLGYLGSEVATPDVFERLLWPGRFYSGFDIFKVPNMALFMPLGGPLHKAALMTLDKIISNGLFKGWNQGHMLGSPFYHDTHTNYTVYDCADTRIKEREHVRNGFWTRVIANLPIPYSNLEYKRYATRDNPEVRADTPAVRSRAIHRVSHLRLSVPMHKPPPSQVINGDVEGTSAQTYLALVITEVSGIAVACCVMAVWKSWFMLLWLVPLILKLVSAFLTVDRHPLEIPVSALPPQSAGPSKGLRSQYHVMKKEDEKALLPSRQKKFEINGLPDGFLIIEGDENLILQFFRHYGHPIRNRFREYTQIIIIIQFGFVFPIGLLCSLLWMPVGIQYVWMSYQLYATCAMHIYRYAGGQTWATTEERIAKAFAKAGAKGQPQRAFLGGKQGVVMAELEVTYHNRYRDGKCYSDELLHGNSLWLRHGETLDSVQSSSETLLSAGDSPRSVTPTEMVKQEV